MLVREKLWLSQVLCAVCEKQVQFKVAQWDANVSDEATDEEFTARPAQFMIKEECVQFNCCLRVFLLLAEPFPFKLLIPILFLFLFSSECCQRYCFHQFRHLKLGIFPMGGSMHDSYAGDAGWPTDVEPLLEMEKPCKIPIVCGCCMFCKPEMLVSRPAQPDRNVASEYFGRVEFDWKWWNCFFPCETFMSVKNQNDQEIFTLRRPVCCSMKDGCCVNVCAPSCCNAVHKTSIEQNGVEVGEMKNIWPGWNMRGCFQSSSAADNFALIYPVQATVEEKSLLLAGLMLHNFTFWETRSNQNGGGGGGGGGF